MKTAISRLALLLLVLLPHTGTTQTRIAGDLSGMSFTAGSGPYIVEQDIIVPPATTVRFEAGTVFLFKPFTGLHVEGTLTVSGTAGNPVIFTSIHDSTYNPASSQLANPFDWNGIRLSGESGNSALRHFHLKYSVYGLKSASPEIVVEKGLFRQNGQYHFTINEKIQVVQDNIPYSYNTDIASTNPPVSSEKTPKPRAAVSPQKNIFRYGSLGIGIGGLGAGAAFLFLALQEAANLDALNNEYNPATDDADEFTEDWNRMTEARDGYTAAAIVLGSIGVLGAAGFTLTFVF